MGLGQREELMSNYTDFCRPPRNTGDRGSPSEPIYEYEKSP